MTIDFGSYGFDYTRDLCLAIEQYTANAEHHCKNAFLYRGMQLKHAVERHLYIQCINSKALFQHYSRKFDANPGDKNIPPLSAVETEIALLLAGTPALSGSFSFIKKHSGRLAYLTAQRIYAWLRTDLFHSQKRIYAAEQRHDILLHVVNFKFANYLAPITQRLGVEKYAYLTTTGSDLSSKIREAGHPTHDWPSSGTTLQSILLSPSLSEFLQLVHEADARLTALSELKPKCVMVVEGNAPADVITAEACRLLNIPCFCVQQGWSPYIHNGFRNMAYTEMFVWGERFAQLLEPYNPRQKFRITGSHALQATDLKIPDAQTRTFSFFLQAPCALLSVAAYDAFVNLIAEAAKAHPQIQFVIREHPGYPLPDASKENFSACRNVRFSIPSVEPLATLIASSEVVASIFSTVLLEALPMNSVPLICSIGSMPSYQPDLMSLHAAVEVHSVAEARRVIDDVIADSSKLEMMRKHLSSAARLFFDTKDATTLISQRLLAECQPSTKEVTHEAG